MGKKSFRMPDEFLTMTWKLDSPILCRTINEISRIEKTISQIYEFTMPSYAYKLADFIAKFAINSHYRKIFPRIIFSACENYRGFSSSPSRFPRVPLVSLHSFLSRWWRLDWGALDNFSNKLRTFLFCYREKSGNATMKKKEREKNRKRR